MPALVDGTHSSRPRKCGRPVSRGDRGQPCPTGEGWEGMGLEPGGGKFWKQPSQDQEAGLTQTLAVLSPSLSAPVLWSCLANVRPIP